MKPKNYLLLAAYLFLGYNSVLAQVAKPFTPRLTGNSISVKGDIVIIGNNILSKTVDNNNNNVLPVFSPAGDPLGTVTNLAALTALANQNLNTIFGDNRDNNNGYNQEYINVDPQAGIFNSSRADLNIVLPPNTDGSVNSCKQIVYAGLYWTAIYPYERSTNSGSDTQGTPRFNDWNQMKFKVPGGAYQDIFAQDVIYNDNTFTPVPPDTRVPNTPYVCYKDVTSIIQGLTNANGQYFGANIRAAKGRKNSGCAGGWSLVIIYESPKLPSKYISVFDGYVGVNSTLGQVGFDVNGFKTLPIGPNPASPLVVKAKIGVSTIEGEKNLFGDNLEIKANSVATYTKVTNTLNPNNNVFNSSITNLNTPVVNRNPASQNTLGFDLDMLDVPNPPGNTVLPNNETGAKIRISSTSDTYGIYLATFAVDIIEPKIELTKVVRDAANVLIPGGSSVTLGQPLEYVIGFKNIGNDNAQTFTIRDVLPINTIFNPADLALPGALPPGVTFLYTPATRTLVFTIPNSLVVINGPRYEIKIRVRIVNSCSELSEACSNNIQNQAFATYSGQINQTPITEDPSLSTFTGCDLGAPSTSNVLVGIENCVFTQNVTICGASTVLTAPGPSGPTGYTQYTWSGPGTITPVPNTNNQQVTVTQPGVYSVYCLAVAPCRSITQVITVTPFVGTPPAHPVIDDADVVRVCTDDGVVQMPEIYLCGANDTRLIDSGITGNIVTWQVRNINNCPPPTNVEPVILPGQFCPRPLPICAWQNVPNGFGPVNGVGPDFTATTPGKYRLTISDASGSCSLTYYFEVFQNVLLPIETHRDIICNTPGNITVTGSTGPLSGYEYSLNPSAAHPWPNTTGVFSITTPGVYTVYITLATSPGSPVGCVFTVPNIQIRQRVFSVTPTVTNPLCNGDKGTIRLDANGVEPQYTFSLFTSSGTLIQTIGPINPNTYTFPPQNPGTYNYTVTTSDGCSATGTVTITAPLLLTATSAVTKPITCTPGEITAYPVGGSTQPTPVYIYSLFPNFTPFQTNPNFPITTAGTYIIYVADQNGCKTQTSVTITNNPPPVFNYTTTNILCYGDNTGIINFVSTTTPPSAPQANGYTLEYSINGLAGPYSSSPNFTGVTAGTYTLIIKYSLNYPTGNTAVCFTAAQTVTITQPATALTASGGVSAVACDTNGGNGEVRITNPQGGTPPYTYNFNNGVGPYGPSNIANLPPGNYTICIKDSNGCTFCMPVTLDPIPPTPTISLTPPVYNCDGTSTTTVTVNNPSGTNYNYTYDIVPPLVPPHNPTSNIFTNVPCGPSNITVNYELVSVPTYSNLLFEDFGVGINTTSPGIAPAYCWNNQPFPPGQPCGSTVVGYPPANCASTLPYGSTYVLEDNQYVVTSALNPNICSWFDYRDHTTNGVNPNGRFLAVNIGDAAGPFGILYSKQINDILPNQPVTVELYVANLIRAGLTGFAEPDFRIELVDGSNNVVAFQTVGAINNNANAWQFKTISLNPLANTSLTFVIRSGSILYNGNDALIDDIKVFQLPKACISTRSFPIILPCNQAFAAQVTSFKNATCFGANDGTVTIAAQNFNVSYQYSINNGNTWVTTSTTPLVIPIDLTLTGVQAYPGFVLVRYDSTTPSTSPCSTSLPQPITQPTQLIANATFTQPTCLVGGTITGSATGGLPNYQYQLSGTTTNPVTTVNIPYQSGNVFSNLAAGSYILTVRDLNNCSDPINAPIDLTAPLTPNASIAGSDICFDNVNQATITITASNGLPQYQYSIDNGVNYSTNNVYPVTPGTYTILVRDANGCLSNAITQIIAPRLTLDVTVTKKLDCTTAPPVAIMTGDVSGGTTPYTYQVSFNGVPAPFPSFIPNTITVAGLVTTFTYNTQNAGTYVFQVTDATGCLVQSQTLTIPALTIPTATITTTPTSCSGFSNGTIIVNASSGLPAYSYAITAPPAFTITQTSSTFTGLPAGTYTVVVTDQNSCTYTDINVVIGGPAPINFVPVVQAPQCTPPILGSISVTSVTGGTAGYTYQLINQNNPSVVFLSTTSATGANYTFDNLPTGIAFGTYTVVIIDASGCRKEINNIVVASAPNDLDLVFSDPAVNCTTGACINVSVPVTTVGSGPYFFSIFTGTLSPYFVGSPVYFPEDAPLSRAHKFCNLIPGLLYEFIVYDTSTNCYYKEAITTPLPPLDPITAIPVPNNVTCTGANDGSVTFTATGVTGTSVNYQILNSDLTPASPVINIPGPGPFTTTSPSNLPPGFYILTLSEVGGANAGCTNAVQGTFQISQSAVLLSVTAVETKKDNCNFNAGIVTITASNGTPQYLYQLLPFANPAPIATTPGWVNTNAIATESGSFIAYVKDAYGCIRSFPVTVGLDPLPTVTVGLANQCVLPASSYTFTAVGAGGIGINYTYSIDGVNYQTSGTFTVPNPSAATTYTINVRDENLCNSLVPATIIIYPSLDGSATFTTPPTCLNADGQITINAIGGSGNYTYSIAPPGPTLSSVNVFSNAAAGINYTITITDVTTTCTKPVTVTLVAPTAVTFIAPTTTPTSCTGASNGTLTVNLAPTSAGVNDNPIYQYQIIAPPLYATALQNSPTFTGLPFGTYTIRVVSGRGCPATQDIQIIDATPVVVPAPTVVQFACAAGTNTNNNATIQVTGVTGGTGPYTYQFVNSANTVVQAYSTNNTFIESILIGGIYTINVKDSNGCVRTTTATINPFIKLNSFTVNVTRPITCINNEEIQILVNSTGGTPPTFNYSVVAISPASNTYNQTNTTGAFVNMPIGDYNITVTNPVTNCSISNIHYVNNPNTFNLSVTNIVNATCFNGSNGSATLTIIDSLPTPTNDAGPFSYTIVNSSGPVTSGSSPTAGPFTIPFGFPAGVYTVTATLTNPPTCTVTKVFTISQPTDIIFTAVETANVTCTNDKGVISVNVSGGTPRIAPNAPYLINVLNTTTNNNYGTQTTGLTAGVYTITVTDANNCPKTVSVTLALPTQINASVVPGANPLCFDGQTDVTISNITGGQGSNYSYSIKGPTSGTPIPNNGPQPMPGSGTVTVPGLVNGSYEVNITDGWNCSRMYPFTITQPQQMVASLTTLAPPTCSPNTASLQLSVTGGTPPFRYSISNTGPFTVFTGATSTIFINVPAGNYSYYVQDGNGCISNASNPVNVPLVPGISLLAPPTVGNISCGGDNTGSISLVAQNGVGTYTYTLWSGPAGPPVVGATQLTPGNFTNLLAGNYWVNITSSVDCTFTTVQLTITEPPVFNVAFTPKNVSCRGGDTGGATITISGGTGIVSYSINPLSSSQFFPIPIPNPSIPTVYSLTGLVAGTYDIIVNDQNGCAVRYNLIVTEPATSLTAPNPTFTNEICFGDNNGIITFEGITGGTPPYFATQNYTTVTVNGVITDTSTYVAINNLAPSGANSHVFQNLPGGVTYSIAIKDNNGCISRFNQLIKKGDNIIPNPLVSFPCVNNLPAVKIEVQNLGNPPGFGFDPAINYIFTLNNITAAPVQVGQQATNVFDSATYASLLITPGNYTVDVENQFTCLKTSAPFTISATDVDPLTLVLAQGGLNEIVATSTGGSGGNTYTFNGVSTGNINTYIYGVTAIYTVVVTDSSGCTATAAGPFVFIPIEIPNVFTPNEDGNNDGWAPQNTSNYKNLIVYIYDRYGRKIAELKQGQTWNGKYNNNELPTGDYWYVIKVNENDDREYVGHFTLYR
ncbi:T9SS type B sorting domain-containing protein [Flavobacterium sp.]|uniref:T9SS type B sorting domain-containing protein n=1 Tax=Flavobacterium sp. TaxID=239 RepID=UPI003753C0B8